MNPSTRVLILLVVVPALLGAQAPSAASAAPGAITIGRTDTLSSTMLKERRPYLVYTPPSYNDTTYAPRNYPVLYVLDGAAHFHSVTGLIQILGTGVNGTYAIPEMIVVAIPNTNRMRDLSPTNSTVDMNGKPSTDYPGGGGMENFLRFISTELIPHIDSAYRTAPFRVFVGHSLGGITTINALYTMPEMFNAYVAIDPSLWWDNRLLLNKAKAYFSVPKPPGRMLYVAQANTLLADDSLPNGHFGSIVQFNRVLERYNASGIRYGFKYYADNDHGSVPLIAEYDALRFIFDGYNLDMQAVGTDLSKITDHFARVSARMGYRVTPPEFVIDRLSRATATGRDSTKALPMLQLNAELYPRSAHAFMSLGDLLANRKDTSGARTAYERALAIRPGHVLAREALRKLNGGK